MNLKELKEKEYYGPGMYEFYDKTRTRAPRYRFGTEKRGLVKKSDTPWAWTISYTIFI